MKRKKILIVNWGTQDKQYVFAGAKKKHFDIYIATSANYPKWLLRYTSKKNLIITNTYDGESLLIDVITFLNRNRIKLDCITTFFEMNIIQTADLANALGMQFISPAAARRSSNNKLLMRYWCQIHKIPTPKYAAFSDIESGLKTIKQFKQSIIIKPIKSGHSYGVIKIEGGTNKELRNDFVNKYPLARKQLDAKYDEWMSDWPYKNKFLMEEYVEGKVISVDGLIQQGKNIFTGIAEFELSAPPLMLEQTTHIPARLPPKIVDKCIRAAKQICTLLEFDNCGFHCEMKLTSQGPILLEIAARLPGGQMLEGYRQAFNIDLADMYFDICRGHILHPVVKKPRQLVLQESIPFNTLQNEVVIRVEGSHSIINNTNCTIFSICKPGDTTHLTEGIPAPKIYYQVVGKSVKEIDNKRACVKKNLIAITQSIHTSRSSKIIHKLLRFPNKSYSIVMDKYRQFFN